MFAQLVKLLPNSLKKAPESPVVAVPGLLLFLSMLVAGSLGLAVLMDEKGESALSQSDWGVWYRETSLKYASLTPALFNVGLIGCIICIVKLTGADKPKGAAASKSSQAAKPGEAKAETKKTK